MDFWNILLENNASLLIFSASGFLVSLFWYVLSERRRRFNITKKESVDDESSFFGHFDDIENPALKIPDFNLKSGPRSTTIPRSITAKSSSLAKSQAKSTSTEDSSFSSELDRKLSSLLPDMPEEVKNQIPEPKEKHEPEYDDEKSENDHGPDDDDEQMIKEFLAATAQMEKEKSKPSLEETSQPKHDEVLEPKGKDGADLDPLEIDTAAMDSSDIDPSNADSGAAVVAQSNQDDAYDEDYDEDERRVKDLLEQIKKDMREQGEHTS